MRRLSGGNMFGGYAGKILFVDLSRGIINEETVSEKTYRDFIGANGLGIRMLYERMKPGVDALGPGNILGFVTGVLTANPVPGSGRYTVVTKSPLTGSWTESNSGGTFGPELKTAGYDGVFFTGISPKPVYLLIKDGKAELRDAASAWGKDTYQTEDILHQELGDKDLKIACIGPGGEACSLLAGIVNEKGRIAARGGVGAVMGSKKLKALVVKGGFKKITAGNPDKLKEVRAQFQNMIKNNEFAKGLTAAGTGCAVSFLVSIGDSPLKNWRLSGTEALPTVKNLDTGNLDKYKLSSYGCLTCPIRCGAIIRVKEGPYAIAEEMHRPEYESVAALGGLLMNDNLEAVVKANDICNRYGVDTMSVGGTIALAMECYERGLITRKDTDGLELTWGNAQAIVAITEKMAKREGFGAVLADGADKAAARIGKGAEKYVVAIRGKSLAYHDPRMAPPEGTAFIADANPAHHMDCQITGMLNNGAAAGSDPALQVPKTNPFGDYDKKGPVYAIGTEYHQLLNAAGMCAIYTINTAPPPVAELIAGVTGWDFGWAEGLKAGKRILTLRQAFNAREGLSPDKITMPKRILEEPLTSGPAANLKIDFETQRKSYFAEMGWDINSGKPWPKTLAELGLAEITSDLK
jgi:aldehyde:ferredoxin oxidoreductase